jgi:hypothetical protein
MPASNPPSSKPPRARLVTKYRANPAPWPDGIDSASDRWYGDGSAWTAERIAAALAQAGQQRRGR